MRTISTAARVLLGVSLAAFSGCQKEAPTPANSASSIVGVADATTSTVTLNCPSSFVVGQAAT
ncbi:MAG TPA: hypothetical protein VK364_01695, partial [Hymenobacter sp.]|nr:hypothetical protein [Hymenobacter sp.]